MLVNIQDYEDLAATRLSQSAYDYYRGGARDEVALGRNRRAYSEYALHYRVLTGTGEIDLRSQCLGHPLSLPIMAAPTAFHCMADPEGEVASARAVTAEGTIFINSTLSNQPVESVIQHSQGPVFFQLYVYKDRAVTVELIQRAVAAGARALVVTVDAPVLAIREKDLRNQFTLPEGLGLANLTGLGHDSLDGSGLADYVQRQLNPALGWPDLQWLVQESPLPVVLKGVVRADDARRAADLGVRAVVVSNHGGRQLDGAPATLHCVAAVRKELPEDVEVWLDGGIRRGADVVLGLCLGAQVVLVGRPILWGLAARGEQGVREVLQILRREMEETMLLLGCPKVSQLDPSFVERLP